MKSVLQLYKDGLAGRVVFVNIMTPGGLDYRRDRRLDMIAKDSEIVYVSGLDFLNLARLFREEIAIPNRHQVVEKPITLKRYVKERLWKGGYVHRVLYGVSYPFMDGFYGELMRQIDENLNLAPAH